MRHGKKFNALGRKKAHRKALLANLSIALIKHKRISTTLAKAKALRRFLEPIVTKAKTNTTHSRRVVFSYLQDKEAVKELFGPIAAKVGDRPGGYLRIFKTGFRQGDGAEMSIIEFVDFNELMLKEARQEDTGKRRTRRGRRRRKPSDEVSTTPTDEVLSVEESGDEVVEEDVADESDETSDKE